LTLIDGRDLFSVRRYDSLGAIYEGVARTTGAALKDEPGPAALSALSMLLAGLPALALAVGLKRRDYRIVLGAGGALVTDIWAVRRFARALTGRPQGWTPALLQPLGQLLYLGMMLGGLVGPALGFSRSWKGRWLDGQADVDALELEAFWATPAAAEAE
jgi:hypothetical protein